MQDKIFIWRNLFNRQLCNNSKESQVLSDEQQTPFSKEKINLYVKL